MSEALNVIKAHFGAQREVTTAPVWQYDYGQILEIDGIPNLPSTFEIHYSNSKARGTAKRWIGYDGAAEVLDEYFVSGADIWCFIVLHEGANDGETEYVIHIPVKERSEAEDSEPTPVQRDIVDEAIAAINAGVAQCEAYVEHYPTVINGEWYVWDEATEQFVSTGVAATGNGIERAKLNSDYTLTLTFTDGTSFTTPISIRGEKGDKGDPGEVPDFSIGTVTTLPAGSSASASITGTQKEPVLNLSIPQGQDGAITNLDTTLTASGKAADAKATGDAVNDLKEDLVDVKNHISATPHESKVDVLNYAANPLVVASGVTVHDGKVLNSSGSQATSSGSMWYEFATEAGESFDVSGRLSNYAVVLFDGSTPAKIYLIADIGAEITASGIGTYNSGTKSYANWNLVIPEYDVSTFPYHVDRVGITAASYSTTGSNTTPVCKKNVMVSDLIYSQDLADSIDERVKQSTPITDFPVYLKNAISYKPTGAFAKPYICLSTDDGREGLIHQTIEMVVNEAHVPVTFCIHSHSDIFYAQKRKKYTLAEVASSIGGAMTNYGCELALHDNKLWADKDASHKTPYTEKTLADFVASEQAFFANPYEIDTETPLGVSWLLKSASAPEHATDQIVSAVMGGTFGILRSGDTSLGTIKNIYNYKCIGARSNLYCLPCKNFNSSMYNTLQKCKDAVDYAVANSLVLPIFWHEAIMEDSTTESDANEHISDTQISDLLLPMIAYAKQQNVEFVTLSQIQNLI